MLMKVKFKETPNEPPHVFMRSAGYARHENRAGEVSWVRRISGMDFPRYHVYVQEGEPVIFSIHIDQKAPTYDGFSAHNGEYDGPLIDAEVRRIQVAVGSPIVVLLSPNGQPKRR